MEKSAALPYREDLAQLRDIRLIGVIWRGPKAEDNGYDLNNGTKQWYYYVKMKI